MAVNKMSFNQISAEMNAIHAQAIGAQPPRAINTGAVITQAQAALLGADVQLVPLTVTENDVYNPPAGKGFGTVTVNVPNPNSMETITGTVANPWSDLSIDVLASAISTGNATAYLEVDGSALGFGSVLYYVQNGGITDNSFPFGGCAFKGNDNWNAGLIQYDRLTKELIVAKVLMGGITQDLINYAPMIPAILTVIHHPLPEGNT